MPSGGLREERWANVQPFQTRIKPKQVIQQLNTMLGKGTYDLERQDATTWVVRSDRMLTPYELESIKKPLTSAHDDSDPERRGTFSSSGTATPEPLSPSPSPTQIPPQFNQEDPTDKRVPEHHHNARPDTMTRPFAVQESTFKYNILRKVFGKRVSKHNSYSCFHNNSDPSSFDADSNLAVNTRPFYRTPDTMGIGRSPSPRGDLAV